MKKLTTCKYIAIFALLWGRYSIIASEPIILRPICPAVSSTVPKSSLYLAPGSPALKLSEKQTKAVCGDPQSKTWKQIPFAQAKLHLEAVLENFGFYYPVWTEKGDWNFLDLGKKTFVTEVAIEGDEIGFDKKHVKYVIGEVLTPKILEKLQATVEEALEYMGYPCPKVEVKASSESGKITVELNPGKKTLARVVDTQISDRPEEAKELSPEIFHRYFAFTSDAPYDKEGLRLTNKRIESSGVAESSEFEKDCTDDAANLTHKIQLGAPRVISMGAGLSTERGGVVYSGWKHTRIGNYGSSFDVKAKASYRDSFRNEQEAEISSRWYGLGISERFYIQTSLEALHESLQNYRALELHLYSRPSITWDTDNYRGSFQFGPSLNRVFTYRGQGRREVYYTSLYTKLHWISHDLELQSSNPLSGREMKIETEWTENGVASDITMRWIGVEGRSLWNLNRYSPTPVVFGLRWKFNLTDSPNYAALPGVLRDYLGGSYDLRGYGLREIPGPIGAPTTAYMGTELRFVDIWPLSVQPFLLFDVARAGSAAGVFDSPWYFSAGPGFRWNSPVGLLRTSFARGWASGAASQPGQVVHSQWLFLVTFGEEF